MPQSNYLNRCKYAVPPFFNSSSSRGQQYDSAESAVCVEEACAAQVCMMYTNTSDRINRSPDAGWPWCRLCKSRVWNALCQRNAPFLGDKRWVTFTAWS